MKGNTARGVQRATAAAPSRLDAAGSLTATAALSGCLLPTTRSQQQTCLSSKVCIAFLSSALSMSPPDHRSFPPSRLERRTLSELAQRSAQGSSEDGKRRRRICSTVADSRSTSALHLTSHRTATSHENVVVTPQHRQQPHRPASATATAHGRSVACHLGFSSSTVIASLFARTRVQPQLQAALAPSARPSTNRHYAFQPLQQTNSRASPRLPSPPLCRLEQRPRRA